MARSPHEQAFELLDHLTALAKDLDDAIAALIDGENGYTLQHYHKVGKTLLSFHGLADHLDDHITRHRHEYQEELHKQMKSLVVIAHQGSFKAFIAYFTNVLQKEGIPLGLREELRYVDGLLDRFANDNPHLYSEQEIESESKDGDERPDLVLGELVDRILGRSVELEEFEDESFNSNHGGGKDDFLLSMSESRRKKRGDAGIPMA